jgi:hypothetical protein
MMSHAIDGWSSGFRQGNKESRWLAVSCHTIYDGVKIILMKYELKSLSKRHRENRGKNSTAPLILSSRSRERTRCEYA